MAHEEEAEVPEVNWPMQTHIASPISSSLISSGFVGVCPLMCVLARSVMSTSID